MPTTATRLITLIMLLQSQPNQKASALAEQLGVSVRTVHRYMSMLDEIGIPVYTERGPYGGFWFVARLSHAAIGSTPDESIAVTLGTSIVRSVGASYPAGDAGALAKIENLLPDEQCQEVAWARRSLIATGMHRMDLDTIGESLEVRRASRARKRILMQYHSPHQTQAVQRAFDVYAVVHRWGWWYAIGYCHHRQAVRTFHVDRIQSLIVLQRVFRDAA